MNSCSAINRCIWVEHTLPFQTMVTSYCGWSVPETEGLTTRFIKASFEPVVPPLSEHVFSGTGLYAGAFPRDFLAWVIGCLGWDATGEMTSEDQSSGRRKKDEEEEDAFCQNLWPMLRRLQHTWFAEEKFLAVALMNGPFCDRLDGSPMYYWVWGPMNPDGRSPVVLDAEGLQGDLRFHRPNDKIWLFARRVAPGKEGDEVINVIKERSQRLQFPAHSFSCSRKKR